jgi:alpha-L-fucosidase
METLNIKKTDWFTHDRFGMFIHFGLYTTGGLHEWVRCREKIRVEDYQRHFDIFHPEPNAPVAWAKAAKAAGMKYMVMTAKHHDGFCLFDSALTEYKSTRTPYGADLVAEYIAAARAEELNVGLYYSLIDWHHPHYPKYADAMHPMNGVADFKDEAVNFDRYLDYMHGQVRELCANYGKIDIMWFDFSYDDMQGEKWRAAQLMEMVRGYHPQIIINNRLEGSGWDFGTMLDDAPTSYAGDFASPEQYLPVAPILKKNGDPMPWELCATIGNEWSHQPATDVHFKSADYLIRKLVRCISMNGNMLLNIGPDAKGRIPAESFAVLEKIAAWMEHNSQAVYGGSAADLPMTEWGCYTRTGDTIYAHIFEVPMGPMPLIGLTKDAIKSVRFLADGREAPFTSSAFAAVSQPNVRFVSLGDPVNANNTYPLSDTTDTVLVIELH